MRKYLIALLGVVLLVGLTIININCQSSDHADHDDTSKSDKRSGGGSCH